MKKLVFVIVALMFTAACQETNISPKNQDQNLITGQSIPASQGLQVLTSEGTPLAGASLMIGTAPGVPFANNILTTDKNGGVAIPKSWSNAQPITVFHSGYTRVTYMNMTPGNYQLTVHAIPQQQEISLKGNLTGFGNIPRDGEIEVGLAVPSLNRQDLFRFDISQFLSPETDTISVIGKQVEVPGNITLPNQRKRYGIIPINLNKPHYALKFNQPGSQQTLALHGQFNISEMMRKVNAGAPFSEIANLMRIRSLSLHNVNLNQKDNRADLPVNQHRVDLVAQVKASVVRSDEILVAAAIAESNGAMLPTGFAILNSNESGSLTLSSTLQKRLFATVRKRRSDFETSFDLNPDPAAIYTLSAALESITTNVISSGYPLAETLPLVNQPDVITEREVRLYPPSTINGVRPAATYGTLSQIERVPQGEASIEKKTVLWEVYAHDWQKDIQLPVLPEGVVQPGLDYRWDVSFIGQRAEGRANLGPELLDRATHVSISAKDF